MLRKKTEFSSVRRITPGTELIGLMATNLTIEAPVIEFLVFALLLTVPFDLLRKRFLRRQRRLDEAFNRARFLGVGRAR